MTPVDTGIKLNNVQMNSIRTQVYVYLFFLAKSSICISKPSKEYLHLVRLNQCAQSQQEKWKSMLAVSLNLLPKYAEIIQFALQSSQQHQ
jgi:hypothetical protein